MFMDIDPNTYVWRKIIVSRVFSANGPLLTFLLRGIGALFPFMPQRGVQYSLLKEITLVYDVDPKLFLSGPPIL